MWVPAGGHAQRQKECPGDGVGAPPQRADLVLSSDIPHGEVNVLVLDGLDVEADGGDGGDNLAELELV